MDAGLVGRFEREAKISMNVILEVQSSTRLGATFRRSMANPSKTRGQLEGASIRGRIRSVQFLNCCYSMLRKSIGTAFGLIAKQATGVATSNALLNQQSAGNSVIQAAKLSASTASSGGGLLGIAKTHPFAFQVSPCDPTMHGIDLLEADVLCCDQGSCFHCQDIDCRHHDSNGHRGEIL